MEEKGLKNVIIRNLTDRQREDIKTAMKETGMATASKALLAVCAGYSRMVSLYRGNQKEVERLRTENRKMKECLRAVMKTQQDIRIIMDSRTQES